MMKFIFTVIFISQYFTTNLRAEEKNPYWEGLTESFSLLLKAAPAQFTTRNNLYYLAGGVGASWWAFEEDTRVSELYRSKDLPKAFEITGDLGVVFNFPLFHISSFVIGHKTGNKHLTQFAKEYFAAMYLALAESGALSFIQVHERPVNENNSFWEKGFRGGSSWPSGHVIPFMVLFHKTMQFYGPWWSTIPLALSYFASYQRMQEGKHYPSDVIGSFFLSAFASEAVREVAGYHKNHPFYKWVFEHDVKVSLIRYKNVWGPGITYRY